MTANIEGDNLVIRVPIELMEFAQGERPDFPLSVNDTDSMSRWVEKRVLTFGGDSEEGVSEFERFLDKMFVTAYGDGEFWLDPVNIE